MDTKEFDNFLTERFEDQVNWYDRKAAYNQKLYKRFQWIVIILSASTPVLVAISNDNMDWLHYMAIAISSIVAILTTALKTFRYQEHWLNYRTTCETLRKEKVYFDTGTGAYNGIEDKEKIFVERVESIISQENSEWISNARQKRKESD